MRDFCSVRVKEEVTGGEEGKDKGGVAQGAEREVRPLAGGGRETARESGLRQ